MKKIIFSSTILSILICFFSSCQPKEPEYAEGTAEYTCKQVFEALKESNYEVIEKLLITKEEFSKLYNLQDDSTMTEADVEKQLNSAIKAQIQGSRKSFNFIKEQVKSAGIDLNRSILSKIVKITPCYNDTCFRIYFTYLNTEYHIDLEVLKIAANRCVFLGDMPMAFDKHSANLNSAIDTLSIDTLSNQNNYTPNNTFTFNEAYIQQKIIKSVLNGRKWQNITIKMADLNGDGLQDAVADCSYPPTMEESGGGGNAIGEIPILVILINNGRDLEVETTDFYANGQLQAVRNGGIMVIRKDEYKSDDPRCCPSIPTTVNIKYSNRNLLICKNNGSLVNVKDGKYIGRWLNEGEGSNLVMRNDGTCYAWYVNDNGNFESISGTWEDSGNNVSINLDKSLWGYGNNLQCRYEYKGKPTLYINLQGNEQFLFGKID